MRSTRSSKTEAKTVPKVIPAQPKPSPAKSGKELKRAASARSDDPVPTKKMKKEAVKPQPTPTSVKPEAAKPEAAKPEAANMKTVALKSGGIPVDEFFYAHSPCLVYSKNSQVFAVTLNQSNIQGNNNKFYIIQVLQDQTNPNNFYFFTRWGRVGVQGQQAQFVTNQGHAVSNFYSKRNEKIRGGYQIVEMNYEDDKKTEEKKEVAKTTTNEPEIKSTLPEKVQSLVRLIFDMKMMDSQMKQIGYDAKKMPLGRLARSSILKGYEALKNLMDEVKKTNKNDQLINNYSSNFYSVIPHDFGFQKMQYFKLDTEQKVKAKLEMLQSLQDIQVFTKILEEGKISSDMNVLDSNYLKLNTEITPLDPASETYKLLCKYVENTHAATHKDYRLEVIDIFTLKKDQEIKRYKTEIDNKQLLWHGSRLTNFVGILSQGLRIAPPEAPVTGYMFGKGVYFADMVTKSANYCFTSRENNTGLMLLCEVALGGMNEKIYADYYANLLPPGKHSTKGVGKQAPNEAQCEIINGVQVPCGRSTNTNVLNSSLLYNEFIVYDVSQIVSRYLFRMKFNYNR